MVRCWRPRNCGGCCYYINVAACIDAGLTTGDGNAAPGGSSVGEAGEDNTGNGAAAKHLKADLVL